MEKNDSFILKIPDSTNYWFIRANGGKYYTDFLENNFIAIADNNISYKDISELNYSEYSKSIDNIKYIYAEKYVGYSSQQLTLYSKRLFNFAFIMKKNDVVIVPSKSSNKFIIGVIISNLYDTDMKFINNKIENQNQYNYNICNYIKRRDVIWIKEIQRSELPEKMYWLLSAHQSFFDISKYSERINDLISPFYEYKKIFHANAFVNKKEEISIPEWNELTNYISNQFGTNSNIINMSAEVHSPGWLSFQTSLIDPATTKMILKAICSINGIERYVVYGTAGLPLFNYLINIIFGKEIKKIGIIKWVQEYNSKHYSNKIDQLKLQELEREKKPNFPLEIKNVGISIDNQKKKENDDIQR